MTYSDILTLFTALFTGCLAVIGWFQYRKTTELSKDSTTSLMTFQLNELMTKKAKDCNEFFPYGPRENDDLIKAMHCFNEIVISMESLDHLLENSYKDLLVDKINFKKIFWLNLNTRIREVIQKNGYSEIDNKNQTEEYQKGHKLNSQRIQDYFRNFFTTSV